MAKKSNSKLNLKSFFNLSTLGKKVPFGLPRSPHPTDFLLLLVLVTILNLFGLVMVLSASSVISESHYGSPWVYFEHQALWVLLGAIALFVVMQFDYRYWRRWVPLFLGACIVMLIGVLVPGVGVKVLGSSRWIGYGSLRIQPSEIVKLALVFFYADLFSRRKDKVKDLNQVLRPALMVFGVVGLLVMLQPDMGTTIIIACITFAILYIGGTPGRALLALSALGVIGGYILGVIQPYRRARLLTFLNPWAHPLSGGYQIVQSLVGLGSGHILGVGLGAGTVKWGFLPNAFTDFIFSVIGEELGLVGSLIVVGFFILLAVLGIRIAVRAPDRYGTLVAIGITCWITTQAIVNIGAVIGILPVTGVPLPFISFGGSSLLVEMTGIGVLLNISHQEKKTKLKPKTELKFEPSAVNTYKNLP